MNQHHTIRLSSWARLVGLALLLGIGVLASLGLSSRTAHAQPAATSTVSTCDEATLRSAISNAASGDTITFGCSGTITLSQTLVISKNLTLDGNGQSVTLDGNNSVEVLFVNSGVSFTLNALTVAHGETGTAASGGGLGNDGGTVSISNSTFANNSAVDRGGGLDNFFGAVSISNSTFANNSALDGGGLYNLRGTVSISNSTFANNSAAGGGLFNFQGPVSIGGSIVANNPGGNCFNAGNTTSTGYNLSSDSSCGLTGTGDLQNTDPLLDPSGLHNNGGPTQTIALQQGSPAIDRIPYAPT